MIRDQMRTATRYHHLMELNVAIEKFEATDLEEENGDLTAAKQKADLLRLKKSTYLYVMYWVRIGTS